MSSPESDPTPEEHESESDFDPAQVFENPTEMDLRLGADSCYKCSTCDASCPVAEVDDEFPGPKFQGPEQWRIKQGEDEDIRGRTRRRSAPCSFWSRALHSVTDVFGGGLELRPWRGESERAVCDHFRGTWISPRRWVRYDGSPKDLLLAVGPAVPALLVYGEHVRTVIFALLLVSGGYALVRKPLVDVTERLVRRFPESLARRLPGRFVRDFR